MWFFSEADEEVLPAARLAVAPAEALTDGFSLNRPSEGLGRGPDGRWATFSDHVVRTWYNPVTLKGPYALLEPARSQLFFRNREPLLSLVQTMTRIDGAVQTPFGMGCMLLVPVAVSSTHGWNLTFGTTGQALAIPDNVAVAIQLVAKPSGSYTNLTISLVNKNGTSSEIRFALSGLGSIASATGDAAAKISMDTDGFYAIEIYNNYRSGGTLPAFNGSLHNELGQRTYVGDGISGLYLAYIGAEVGDECTSPIMGDEDGVSIRSADILTGDTRWLSQGSKAFGIEYIPLSRTSNDVLHITGTDGLSLTNTPSSLTCSTRSGTVVSASITGTAPSPGVERTVVMTAVTNAFILTQNGGIVGTDNTGNPPNAFSEVRIGSSPVGNAGGPLLLASIKYWDVVLSAEQARSFSESLAQAGEVVALPNVDVQPTMTILPDASTMTMTVVLSGEPVGATVSYRTIDGTALAARDYGSATGTLVIPPGAPSATVTIALGARSTVEDRSFVFELHNPVGARIGVSTCTILLLRVPPTTAPASTKIDFGATMPANVSLSRDSVAWTRNASGVWASVGANAYRHHYAAPGVSGLLVEGQSGENCVYDSVDCNFSALVGGGTKTVITNGSSPTGARILQFREGTVSEQHRILASLNTVYADHPTGEFTVSFIIRPIGSGRYLRIVSKGFDNVTHIVSYDLFDAGTAFTSSTGIEYGIERDPILTDWYRIWLSRPQTATAGVVPTLGITRETSGRGVTFAGIDGSGFDICHVQVEAGFNVTSPIIVQGATAKTTRAADIVRASGTWYQVDNYTLGVRFAWLHDGESTQRIVSARDVQAGTAADDVGFKIVNGVLSGSVRTVSVDHPAMVGSAVPLRTPTTVLMTAKPATKAVLYSQGVKLGEAAIPSA